MILRTTCVLVPALVLLAGCVTSREKIQAQMLAQTRAELQGVPFDDLILVAQERGLNVSRARAVRDNAATRAAAEPAAREALTAEIALDKAAKQATAIKDFYGVSLGIAPSILFGGPEEVRSAEIVDQGGTPVVHVTESRENSTAILLEAHYFFQPSKILDTYEWGFGPFLGVQVSEDDVLQGIGFGAMVGFRYAEDSSRSFNIGLGMFLDEDVQTLASGFSDGAAPPGGETQVRYDKEDAWRGALMFSFAWGI